jgi:hypothetical protein
MSGCSCTRHAVSMFCPNHGNEARRSLENAALIRADLAMHGTAFVTADGLRIDPADVVVAWDGTAVARDGSLLRPLNG